MVQWSLEIEKRRGKQIAVVALARTNRGHSLRHVARWKGLRLAAFIVARRKDRSDCCPKAVTAITVPSAPARNSDCGSPTDSQSCAVDSSIEREHSIETARRLHRRGVAKQSSARRRRAQTPIFFDRPGTDLCLTEGPLHTGRLRFTSSAGTFSEKFELLA
jgi:hypothetical protein